MSDWKTMDTAPKTGGILVYGQPDDVGGTFFYAPSIYAAYYNQERGCYCLEGVAELGENPLKISPLLWQPILERPQRGWLPSKG